MHQRMKTERLRQRLQLARVQRNTAHQSGNYSDGDAVPGSASGDIAEDFAALLKPIDATPAPAMRAESSRLGCRGRGQLGSPVRAETHRELMSRFAPPAG